MVKAKIKRGLQQIVSQIGRHRWPLRGNSELLILTYHRILPRDHPERYTEQPGMVVEPETLRMHLKVLSEFFEMVSLDAVSYTHLTLPTTPYV